MNLLTPAQFRQHVNTSVADPALQRLLDAAELAITGRVGALTAITERRRGGGSMLYFGRAIGTFTSITERTGDPIGWTDVVLDATDYTLLSDARTVRREITGTHKAERWADDVTAVYTPLDDTAERQRVAIELVKLDLAHQPGLSGQSIGSWSESYAALDYTETRESLIASLAPNTAWFA